MKLPPCVEFAKPKVLWISVTLTRTNEPVYRKKLLGTCTKWVDSSYSSIPRLFPEIEQQCYNIMKLPPSVEFARQKPVRISETLTVMKCKTGMKEPVNRENWLETSICKISWFEWHFHQSVIPWNKKKMLRPSWSCHQALNLLNKTWIKQDLNEIHDKKNSKFPYINMQYIWWIRNLKYTNK